MIVERFCRLICPLDGDPLTAEERRWQCPGGHSFDIARQGYVHLLPVQNKRSRQPGDSKDMVAARQRFLAAGYYQPIAEAVNRAVMAVPHSPQEPLACIDAGCGEGYYLRALIDSQPDGAIALLGLDISKWATMAAAKSSKDVQWVVGSNASLPVESSSTDCVLCLFGFPVYQEFYRVLRTGGQVIQVDAGPDHLRELRDIVYPSVKATRTKPRQPTDGFWLRDQQTIRLTLALPSQQSVYDLLAMTPHLYRASPDGRARALALESLAVTVDARVTIFEAVKAG